MLDWARNRIDDINSITTDELNAYAKQYLGHMQVSRVIIQPDTATLTIPASAPTPAEK